jgi:repressor LexA
MAAGWEDLRYASSEVEKPTRRQRDVLAAIGRLQSRQGRSPTLDELAATLGIRKAAAAEHVRNLEAKGYLTRDRYKRRSIELTDPRTGLSIRRGDARILPVFRATDTGSAGSDLAEAESHLPVPDLLIDDPGEAAFVLRLEDDSMAHAGLLANDMVVVRSTSTALDGQIVAALVETQAGDEVAVVARYRISRSRGVELVSQMSHDRRIRRPRSCTILGVVTGSMRRFEQ